MKFDCADIEERIAAYLVDDLTVQERYWIEMHLRDCAECQAEIDSLQDIAGSLQAEFDSETEFELDPERRAALSQQFAQANPEMDIATRRRRRRIRAMVANMSVAAALLLGAYLGFITGNQRVQSPELPEFTLEIASSDYSTRTTQSNPPVLTSGPLVGVPYVDLTPLATLYAPDSTSSFPSGVTFAGMPTPRLVSTPVQAVSE